MRSSDNDHFDNRSGGSVRSDPITDPRQILGHVSGGRVLDAATGDGQFIRFLVDGLKDHGEIIGIDSAPVEGPLFEQRFADHPGIRFELMDVLDPSFPDASFDAVSIANSLCEFEDPPAVLTRLDRLLRPGGHLIVAAAYRDLQAGPAQVYVDLHDWWAGVDRTLGKVHSPELRRHELVALVSGVGLSDLRFFDVQGARTDPMEAELIARIDGVIDRTIRKVDGHNDLQARGELLRQRMHVVGFQMPVLLVAVGRT